MLNFRMKMNNWRVDSLIILLACLAFCRIDFYTCHYDYDWQGPGIASLGNFLLRIVIWKSLCKSMEAILFYLIFPLSVHLTSSCHLSTWIWGESFVWARVKYFLTNLAFILLHLRMLLDSKFIHLHVIDSGNQVFLSILFYGHWTMFHITGEAESSDSWSKYW